MASHAPPFDLVEGEYRGRCENASILAAVVGGLDASAAAYAGGPYSNFTGRMRYVQPRRAIVRTPRRGASI